MKTIIKTLLVAVTVLFSVNVAAKTIKLPAGIKYVNSTDEFYCTEIDGLHCQTKNLFKYKGNRYVFVIELGGAWATTTLCRYSTWKLGKHSALNTMTSGYVQVITNRSSRSKMVSRL